MFRNKPNTTNAIEINSARKHKQILVQVPYPKTRNLVFKGGGILGVGYGGVLWVLEKFGFLDDVVNVAGSSAGAIAALYVGLGYTADEMTERMSNMDFGKFIGDAHAETWIDKVKKLITIVRSPNISLSSGDELLSWLQAVVDEKINDIEKKIAAVEKREYIKTFRGNATFRELATYIEKAKKYNIPCQLKYLYVAVTVLSAETPDCEICSHVNPLTIDLPIAQAVRASCSFPFLFTTVPIQFNQREDLDQCTDGGVVNNFPIGIFDDKDELPDGISFTKKGTNPGTLGIRMDSKNQREHLLYNIKKKVSLIYASDFAKQYVYALTQALNVSKIRGARNILSVDSGGLSALDTKFDKVKLVESAKKETLEYLRDRIDTLYDYQVYDSVRDWLTSRSLEELEDIQIAYENMLREHTSTWLPGQKWDAEKIIKEFDIRETDLLPVEGFFLTEIISSIQLVKEFTEYKRKKMRDDSLVCDISFPAHHLNIYPDFIETKWNKNVKADMASELDKTKKSIIDLSEKCKVLKDNLDRATIINDRDLIDYICHQEKIKELEIENADLQQKLGIKPDADGSNYFEARGESRRFELFARDMNPILKKTHLKDPFKTVLNNLGLHDPVCRYAATDGKNNFMINLDLRRSSERNIYMIAALLYCKNKNYSLSTYQELREIYQYSQTEVVPIPGGREPFTIDSLSAVLKQTGVDLDASVYRIGKLLHHFEKIHDPKCQPKMDIDKILSVPQLQDSYFLVEDTSDDKKSKLGQAGLIAKQGFFKSSRHVIVVKSDHPQTLNVIDRIAGVVNKVGHSLLMTLGFITNRYSKAETDLISKSIKQRNHFLEELDRAEHILNGHCKALIKETREEVMNGWKKAHERNEHQVFLDYIKVKKFPKEMVMRLDERLESLFQM